MRAVDPQKSKVWRAYCLCKIYTNVCSIAFVYYYYTDLYMHRFLYMSLRCFFSVLVCIVCCALYMLIFFKWCYVNLYECMCVYYNFFLRSFILLYYLYEDGCSYAIQFCGFFFLLLLLSLHSKIT